MIKGFKEDLEKENIILSEKALKDFESYFCLLTEENKITNLTRITSEEDVYYLHFFDSMMVSKAIDFNQNEVKLLDVGSGPGFPGIPLKIAFPSLNISIIEATNKKVEFMKKVSASLNLNLSIDHMRAEDYSMFDTYDYITTRAVSKIVEQLPYTIPFLKVGGKLIAMKGEVRAREEIDEANGLLHKIGAKVLKTINYSVLDRHYTLVVIEKIKGTPKGYPKRITKVK